MLPFALACALGSGSSPARAVDSDPQEAAITKTAEAFVEAFQKGDAKAVASFWTPDGDYVDPSGRVLNGRPAIEKDFADLFAENKGLKPAHRGRFVKIPNSGHGRGGWDHGSARPRWHGPEPRQV
jgi:SnoaL-like domain